MRHPSAWKRSQAPRRRREFPAGNSLVWLLLSLRCPIRMFQDNKKPAIGGLLTCSRRDEALAAPPSRSHQPTAGGYRGTPSPSMILAYAEMSREVNLIRPARHCEHTTNIIFLVRGRLHPSSRPHAPPFGGFELVTASASKADTAIAVVRFVFAGCWLVRCARHCLRALAAPDPAGG